MWRKKNTKTRPIIHKRRYHSIHTSSIKKKHQRHNHQIRTSIYSEKYFLSQYEKSSIHDTRLQRLHIATNHQQYAMEISEHVHQVLLQTRSSPQINQRLRSSGKTPSLNIGKARSRNRGSLEPEDNRTNFYLQLNVLLYRGSREPLFLRCHSHPNSGSSHTQALPTIQQEKTTNHPKFFPTQEKKEHW